MAEKRMFYLNRGVRGAIYGVNKKNGKGGNAVTISEFCGKLYNKPISKSQGAFVSALFYAAGSSYGSKSTKDPKRIARKDYLGKIFRGEELLSTEIRASFSKPFHEKELSAFLTEYIDDHLLPALIGAFQLPNAVEINKQKFILALCRQFQLIVAEDSPDTVNNIVIAEYPTLLACDATTAQNSLPPIYSNDSFHIKDVKTVYLVGCYTQIDHTFILENYSQTIDWVDRYLEFDIASTDKLAPLAQTVPIPTTKHGGKATIFVQVKCKGMEGTFTPKWVIKDKDGNNCFPNRTIGITITVDFNLNK